MIGKKILARIRPGTEVGTVRQDGDLEGGTEGAGGYWGSLGGREPLLRCHWSQGNPDRCTYSLVPPLHSTFPSQCKYSNTFTYFSCVGMTGIDSSV